MSPRSLTNNKRHMTPASARCVAIISGRLGSRSTTSPPSGATRPASPNTKKTSPATLFEPVSVFAQIPRTTIIIQSPNIESDWPAKSSRMSLRARRPRISSRGRRGSRR